MPLLDLICRLILALRPKFVTLEEVQGFLYAGLPRKQFSRRKGAKKSRGKGKKGTAGAAGVAAAAEDVVPAEHELIEEDAVDEEADVGDEEDPGDDTDKEEEPEEPPPGADPVEAEKKWVPVRAWLRIICAMLQADYQIDMRLCNAAHYGAPQNRERLIIIGALRGYQLPTPPPPQFHGVAKSTCFARDKKLKIIDEWGDIRVQSDPVVDAAAVAEAISTTCRA